jgi:uncharacterized hydrophobic protein (TIGR00341 family)
MSSRLIEVFLPNAQQEEAESLLKKYPDLEIWYEPLSQETLWIRIFVDQRHVEALVDQFAQQFGDVEHFRLLLLNVEATVPYPDSTSSTSLKDEIKSKVKPDLDPRATRVNRIEIYDRVADGTDLTWVQIMMVLLSTAIATIGILQDNQTVVIGAMVIAPLLKPNMALAVATTLGDTSFAIRTVWTGFVGIFLALGLSMIIGMAVSVDLQSSEIVNRLRVTWSDGILALASGAAGAIALTTEERSSIVGVMVSVALLPPLVVLGLLLGKGHWALALGASLLVTTNIICLNLAAVTTFLIQDLRPHQWKAVPKAKRIARMAYGIWIVLLMGLVGIVAIARFNGLGPY